MPFCPLPATFLDDLQRTRGPVLELGSGDGTFTSLLRQAGHEPVTLDRNPLATARIRGDALQPPLRACFDLVVAANLVRHLWPRLREQGPRCWRDLLVPGGTLWILEDEPLADPLPARNYRDLQALLAQLVPAGRQPLLGWAEFQNHRRAWNWDGRWDDGRQENTWPLDPAAVNAWLAPGVQEPGGEAARLTASIAAHGLSCGQCWWSRWEREGGT